MKCVIIEDEAIAARRLKKLVETNGVKVVALLHSVQESIRWFQEHEAPDLIFLDIQLGDGLSFEIFEEVQPESAIIFTTAYDEYALRAFKLNSIDYLLKPIQAKELKRALDKYKTLQPEKIVFSADELKAILQTNFEMQYRERFVVNIGQKIKTIKTKDIPIIYSENKGTYIQYDARNYLIDYSLDEVEGLLNPKYFYRISRKAIVQLGFIEDITAHSGSRLLLKVKGNKESWTVSRERVSDFKAWLAH
ncbi:response regulator [Flavobacteriaceae bacterium Ap0902]|nr:response regulator [Flavobacteriaceae bacterium Ap0902]